VSVEAALLLYMPDARYGSDGPVLKYSRAPGYTGIMKTAVQEYAHALRQAAEAGLTRGLAML
jgi:uncharacterized Fe-S radical SAM superfamily protein PflX